VVVVLLSRVVHFAGDGGGSGVVIPEGVAIAGVAAGRILRCIFARDNQFYLILRKIVPGKKQPLAQKLFLFFAATMARCGFGPYHGLCCEEAPTKRIDIIPTLWMRRRALGFGVLAPQPEL
jgi:hypothetical protein